MEEKRTLFDYLAQVLIIFGFATLVLNSFCLIFGDSAKELSAIFRLGRQGIPVEIMFQFLCISALITGARLLFFTDILIKKMSLGLRTTSMLTVVVAVIAVFVLLFHWFPANMWEPWLLFLICFGVSFLGSCFVMTMKERTENRRMEEALRRLKEKEGR